jgi:MoaA/NifB/PqqE/SkfB family radical SAM enzyme
MPSENYLYSINLALTHACLGRCLFCPRDRGLNSRNLIMPTEYAFKIIDETATPEFKSRHNIGKFEVSENGDALIHPDFIDILRRIRSKHPNAIISMFTNFYLLTREKSETICKEKLVDVITTNIDGHDRIFYGMVKGLDYETVERNILDFLEVREQAGYKPYLKIQALTLYDYVNKVIRVFKNLPYNLSRNIAGYINTEKLEDDYEEIRKIWEKRADTFFRSPVFLWAERPWALMNTGKAGNYSCPLLERVKHEAFISPDGDWYICCYDSRYDIKFGNVVETSIQEVFESERRASIIKALEEKRFHDIGYPCITVEACQWV